jgi:hypothetical protein
MDILVQASVDNAEKILRALKDFGFGSLNLSLEDLTTEGSIIQLGYEPVRIDLLISMKGLDFYKIWQQRVSGAYGRQTVNYIDRENLIKLKKLSNRIQDKADLELLESDE